MSKHKLKNFTQGKMLQQYHRIKQDKKCTYNVILRRVRATIVAAEKQ